MVHHIHAFTIHVVALILLKGVLFARNSRLIADKSNLGSVSLAMVLEEVAPVKSLRGICWCWRWTSRLGCSSFGTVVVY